LPVFKRRARLTIARNPLTSRSRGPESLLERSPQFRQRINPNVRPFRLRPPCVNQSPRTTPQKHTHHSRGLGRQHIIVHTIADVCDFLWPNPGNVHHPCEEFWRRLLHSPFFRRTDEINRQIRRAQRLGKIREMIPRNSSPISRRTQFLQARNHIWIEFTRTKRITLTRLPPPLALPRQIKPRSKNLECPLMMFPPLDHATQHRKKLIRRHAQPPRPRIPSPLLIPQREPKVEKHYAHS